MSVESWACEQDEDAKMSAFHAKRCSACSEQGRHTIAWTKQHKTQLVETQPKSKEEGDCLCWHLDSSSCDILGVV